LYEEIEDVKIFLIGNMCDSEREISHEEVQLLSDELQIMAFENFCKNG